MRGMRWHKYGRNTSEEKRNKRSRIKSEYQISSGRKNEEDKPPGETAAAVMARAGEGLAVLGALGLGDEGGVEVGVLDLDVVLQIALEAERG